jgi:predicted Zn-ribbon and HTH transcriptional regulator
MKERVPEEAGATRRQQIAVLLEQGVDYSLEDLKEALDVPVSVLEDDLRHIEKSLKQAGKTLIVTPASCKKCEFVFAGREQKHLHAPSRCPKCKSERIEEPAFRIE